jgi:hypothetical protein
MILGLSFISDEQEGGNEMSGTPAQYAAASAAMHKRANQLILTLPWFEEGPATNFLNGKMMDEFAKIAVDAALAVTPAPITK